MLRSILKTFNNQNVLSSNIFYSKKAILTQIIKSKSTLCSFSDQNTEKREKIVKAEIYLLYSLRPDYIDPELITLEQWQNLFKMESRHQRRKYCRYLHSRKCFQMEQLEKQAQRKEDRKHVRQETIELRKNNPHINYGLGHNSMFPRITKHSINKWQNLKLHGSKLHGQPLILDCSYDEQMTAQEHRSVYKKLERSILANRQHKHPFDIHMCGIKTNSSVIQTLYKQMPNLKKSSSALKITTDNFTDLFPTERLVVLTADSNTPLEYNFHDIYVVGGLVDLGRNDRLTLAKAKSYGLRTACLPLEHIKFGPGSGKELPFSAVIRILLECQFNKNWKEILEKHVPLRKQAKYQHLFQSQELLEKQ